MMCRYRYSFDRKVSYGWYECDIEDFKKLWKKIRSCCEWCVVDIWNDCRGCWDLCDCWEYNKIWKDNGWYKKGWKFMSGV